MEWKRLLKAVGLTLKDCAFDVFNSLMVRPAGARLTSLLTAERSSPWLSQEFWSARTVDGAIVGGSVPPGAWAKFTLPKGLPRIGSRHLAVENSPHELDGFDGQISQGYGKGIKSLLYRDTAIVKIGRRTFPGKLEYHFHEADVAGPHYDLCIEGVPHGTGKFEINVPNGPFKGRYAFNTTTKGIVVVPMEDRGLVLPKPAYSLKPEGFLKNLPESKWLIEAKLDGSLAQAVIHESRATFRSHRDTGETYYDRLPQLEFLSNQSRFFLNRLAFPHPDVNGTVFKGELVHPDGAPRMSGILNALPHRARQIQSLRGPARFYAWDVVKFKGRDVSRRPYEERRALAEAAIKDIRLFNKYWGIVDKCPDYQDPYDFYQEVIKAGLPYGEGVVIKRADQAHGDGSWYKVKDTDVTYWKVVEFLPGEGKYANTVGRIVVENPDRPGAIGEIGSLSVPDSYRDFMWKYRDELTGDVIKAKVQDVTESGRPRAGVFLAFHGGESDLLMTADSQALGNKEAAMRSVYAMKSSKGWSRKT